MPSPTTKLDQAVQSLLSEGWPLEKILQHIRTHHNPERRSMFGRDLAIFRRYILGEKPRVLKAEFELSSSHYVHAIMVKTFRRLQIEEGGQPFAGMTLREAKAEYAESLAHLADRLAGSAREFHD